MVGSFLIQKQGRGGNSHVWLAERDGIQGAFKILKSSHIEEQDKSEEKRQRVERFVSEIEIHRNITDHPGVLPLLDSYCPDKITPKDRPWLVTTLATPLSTYVHDLAFDLRRAVAFSAAIASTLTALHARGVFNRDIKPENLYLLNGHALIGDFGLAAVVVGKSITLPGGFVGPLFYIAPEMMHAKKGEPAGPADVYSLAKTIWVLSTHQHYPGPGEQRAAMAWPV